MKFATKLTEARLIRRYKRFLADVELIDGTIVVAHCANSGSMLGCKQEGATVWLSENTNPKAKLDWRWEMVEVDGALVGINTSHPNKLAEEAIRSGTIKELTGYDTLSREVKYGTNSRIDILLENPGLVYVEVKNVTLKQDGEARFPDAVTSRGAKHLRELIGMREQGHRAVMLYLVQREDCDLFRPAFDIDPAYGEGLIEAYQAGVEILCYRCMMSVDELRVGEAISFSLDRP